MPALRCTQPLTMLKSCAANRRCESCVSKGLMPCTTVRALSGWNGRPGAVKWRLLQHSSLGAVGPPGSPSVTGGLRSAMHRLQSVWAALNPTSWFTGFRRKPSKCTIRCRSQVRWAGTRATEFSQIYITSRIPQKRCRMANWCCGDTRLIQLSLA